MSAAKEQTQKTSYLFHIVNSVKGGCGKSTFSLWLAEYWRDKGEPVYVIDLDIDGSSWADEYGEYYENDNDSLYINDIAEKASRINYLSPWKRIDSKRLFDYDNTNRFNNEENKIKACIADPLKRGLGIGYEVDLFEQAVEGLIKNIVENENISNKRVHIIFDMAPGADKNSERFLKHYLFTNKFLVAKGKFKAEHSFRIYMISTCMISSLKSNLKYIEDLLIKPYDYGSVLQTLWNENKLEARVIINDVTNLLGPGETNPTENSEYKKILNKVNGDTWLPTKVKDQFCFKQIRHTTYVPCTIKTFLKVFNPDSSRTSFSFTGPQLIPGADEIFGDHKNDN